MHGDNVDGNLHALNKYLEKQDELDAAYESVIDYMKPEIIDMFKVLSKAMDDYHSLRSSISEMLEERGLSNDKEDVDGLIESIEEDLLQFNEIDW